jgi:hypothetical protein
MINSSVVTPSEGCRGGMHVQSHPWIVWHCHTGPQWVLPRTSQCWSSQVWLHWQWQRYQCQRQPERDILRWWPVYLSISHPTNHLNPVPRTSTVLHFFKCILIVQRSFAKAFCTFIYCTLIRLTSCITLSFFISPARLLFNSFHCILLGSLHTQIHCDRTMRLLKLF